MAVLLHRPSGLSVDQFNLPIFAPAQRKGLLVSSGPLSEISHCGMPRVLMICSRMRVVRAACTTRVRLECQTLAGERINHDEDANAATGGERNRHEEGRTAACGHAADFNEFHVCGTAEFRDRRSASTTLRRPGPGRGGPPAGRV
ncbi:MAG TPA: hypothetical protein VES20_09440 [Bryobacteraceae bacterium]|nr:hypothetical protein [Bryobacteraceae bacterium]